MIDQSWRASANCAGLPTDLFFPVPGSDGGKIPKRICGNCVVRDECLEDGLYEEFGIRGGKSPGQRRKILRERAASVQQ